MPLVRWRGREHPKALRASSEHQLAVGISSAGWRGLTDGVPVAFVHGEPALLLSRGEAVWQDNVRGCGVGNLVDIRLRFIVSSWRRGGNLFDLDNLVDPVLSVVGAPEARRRSVWAAVEVGDEPGVEISATPPPPAPQGATTVHLRAAPRRSMRTAERLAELVDHAPIGIDEPCGCSLTLGSDTPGLVFGFEGPIKPTIDALWPLLGGAAHSPDDHRIRDLRVRNDPSATGVIVALWSLVDV